MNKASLVIDFKQMVGPAGKGSEVSDPGITVWLNEAKDRIVSVINETIPDYFNKQVTTSSVGGEGEYELPSDFEKATLVSTAYDGTHFVRAFPINNIGQASDVSRNESVTFNQAQPFYYLTGEIIGFQPVFGDTHTDNIKLWYTYNPVDMVEDADEPQLPKKFHPVLKYWAYANYLDQNDEHAAAERMRLRFDDMVERMVNQMSDRQTDMPRTVEVGNDSIGLYTNDWS